MTCEIWDTLALVKRFYDQCLQPVCRRHGLTRMELDILIFLANNPGFDTATDIVERRRLTKSHVSASVKTLESRGYLERKLRGENRKTIHLSLLPAAEMIAAEGREGQRAFFTSAFSGFTAEELADGELKFRRLGENLRRALMGETEDAL